MTASPHHTSLWHDELKEKYYTVDNQIGKRTKVSCLGQSLKRYDVRISGVASTEKRKKIASKVRLFH